MSLFNAPHVASSDPNGLFNHAARLRGRTEEHRALTEKEVEERAENNKHEDTKRFHFPFEPVDERDRRVGRY